MTSTLDPILSEVIQSAFPHPTYCNAVYPFQDWDESELHLDDQSVPPSKQSPFILVEDIPTCLKYNDQIKFYMYSVQHNNMYIVLTLYRRNADCFIWRPSPYRAVNTFHLGYKNQSVYAVSGTSRCLFSDKYRTYKYSVGRAYSCWMLNWWCITWPVGFKRLMATSIGHNGHHQTISQKLKKAGTYSGKSSIDMGSRLHLC